MTSDYEAIRIENLHRYGTDVGVYGDMLLRDRYDDRTHFLFELLQNAEDAYARREDKPPQASVRFTMFPTMLDVRHFGVEFTEHDVRGVCGIGQSTKDSQQIGKFGIGFKSVYAYTERPEIHSGAEAFAIKDYVLPYACEPGPLAPRETSIRLPLRPDMPDASDDILAALKGLGSPALLFLRRIEEISWGTDGAHSGHFLREETNLDDLASIVTIIGNDSERPDDTDEEWLLFRRRVEGTEKELFVEVAFALDRADTTADWQIRPRSQSRLTVFFPTAVDTHCGVAIQGPYKTTPSRDNVKRFDPWNHALVAQTATLIVDALRWLRDARKLEPAVLQCLPIRRDAYEGDGGKLFSPLYEVVLDSIRTEPLLPTNDGGFISAEDAVIGTRDLRALLNRDQLSKILGRESAWLSEGITEDRTADLYNYLTKTVEVRALSTEALISRLTREFLEDQSDEWVLRLYEFLGGLSLGRRRLESRPLVRLTDGSHVPALVNGEAGAYLPSNDTVITGFPLVKCEVVATRGSRDFLQEKLGLAEPDPVEDVILHVLPKYRPATVDASDYEQDLRRISHAASSDSTARRSRLIEALGDASFVQVVDLGTGLMSFAQPSQAYMPTQRIRILFEGVAGVLVVDDSNKTLASDDVRKVVRDAGAVDYLRPTPSQRSFTREELASLRENSQQRITSGVNDRVTDWDLVGLDGLLKLLATFPPAVQRERSALLWEALRDLEHGRGQGIFTATYSWSYYGTFKKDFDPWFIDQLNSTPWVYSKGDLRSPDMVVFESLSWQEHPFLQSKVRFKPEIVDELAVRAGFEPEMLDLLKMRGIRTLDDLTHLLPAETTATTPGVNNAMARLSEATPVFMDPQVGGGIGGEGHDASATTAHPTDGEAPDEDDHRLVEDSIQFATSAGPRERAKDILLGQPSQAEAHEGEAAATRHHAGPTRRPDAFDPGELAPIDHDRVTATQPTTTSRLRTPAREQQGLGPAASELDPDFEVRRTLRGRRAEALVAEYERRRLGTLGHSSEAVVWVSELYPLAPYDVESLDDHGRKIYIEVKATQGTDPSAPFPISVQELDSAREHGPNHWLYRVTRIDDADPEIVRVQDPYAAYERGDATIDATKYEMRIGLSVDP